MLRALLDLYSLVVLIAVVLSWIRLPPENPLVRFIGTATEPVLRPIRRILPPMGGIDLAPLALMLALQLLKRLV